jgi:hypothetical protein
MGGQPNSAVPVNFYRKSGHSSQGGGADKPDPQAKLPTARGDGSISAAPQQGPMVAGGVLMVFDPKEGIVAFGSDRASPAADAEKK